MRPSHHLHWVPIAMLVLGIAKIVSTYLIAIATQYVDPVFPYISTVATGYPQRVIFMLLAFIIAVLLIVCVFVRYKFIKGVLKPKSVSTAASNCSALPSPSPFAAATADHQHPPCSVVKWSRLNFAELVLGVVLTICYAGVCSVPENVKSLRTSHTFLAISMFLSGSAYIGIDCSISFWLMMLQSTRRRRQLGISPNLRAAKKKIVIGRLIIVGLTLMLSGAGLPLLYFADDPLEDHFGDVTKPKIRCNNEWPRNDTGNQSTTFPPNGTFINGCFMDVHAMIHVVTAVIEWLVTCATMVYIATYFDEFRSFTLKETLEPRQSDRACRFSTAESDSTAFSANSNRLTNTTLFVPSSPSAHTASVSVFSDDSLSTEMSPMIHVGYSDAKVNLS